MKNFKQRWQEDPYFAAVSYTHLDVYKRQILMNRMQNGPLLSTTSRLSHVGRKSNTTVRGRTLFHM